MQDDVAAAWRLFLFNWVAIAWALWPVRWIRPIAVLANVMMLAATPIDGGHYFIDLAAGLAVAVLAIIAARRCGQRLAARDVMGDIRGVFAPAE
jgi:membrane-associated phospholipid phosphatase